MSEEYTGTKLALIEAGGALFAEYGLEGASIRAIAERAGANVAAINYHFGGKENLYLEALRHCVSHKSAAWTERVKAVEAAVAAGTPLREALAKEVRAHLAAFFEKMLPPWHMKLIMRTLLEPSPALQALSQEIFIPEFEALIGLARRTNPALTEDQAKLWADTLFAQTLFVSLSRVLILEYEGWKDYPHAFLDRVAEHTAMLLIASLWPERTTRIEEGE